MANLTLICFVLSLAPIMTSPTSDPSSTLLPHPKRGFVSTTPGVTWEQGLLCGNGTIGANLLGQPLDETLIYTHHRLFLPMGPPVVPPDSSARLFEVRRLIDRGLYKQAAQLAFDLSGQESFLYPDPFVPAFDMRVRMPGHGPVRDYARSVDFQTGEATVRWADEAGTFERRAFVSRADGVGLIQISGPGKGSIDCTLELGPRTPEIGLGAKTVEASNEVFRSHVSNLVADADRTHLTFSSTFTRAYPGSIHRLEGVCRVVATGGKVTAEGGVMKIEDADRVLVFTAIEPIYDPGLPKIEAMKKQLDRLPTGYAALLKRHAAIHGKLFNRVLLDLGGGSARDKTSEALIAASTNEDLSPALTEKVFDAGRYNIICSTGELPPTLQGIWAGTYVPAWASDFTHNGNVPSAIAGMLPGNTPELMLAYTSYIESLVPYLRVNAKHIFGARGIILPSRSTTNGYNNALAPDFAGGMWVAGAAWAARFFYDYYLFTGDRAYLKEHALPFMEEAALFFEDYLYLGPDGKYVFNPTTSPENFPKNTGSQATYNATMDVAVAKELFANLIMASQHLGVNKSKIPVWKRMLERMPPYMIGSDGVVKEWLTPRIADNLDHRHSSQLYPLFYTMPDELAKNPKLQAAFRKIVQIKLENHYKNAGFMSFGLVQLGQAAATLGDGALAYQAVVRLVNSYWLSNLASMHNPRSLLNMDVSGGLPAVVIQMLVNSVPGRLSLLPALPQEWPIGAIEGVLCRGQVEVKRMTWKPGQITVALSSKHAQTLEIQLPSRVERVTTSSGVAQAVRGGNGRVVKVVLPAGKAVSFTFTLG